MIVPGFNYRYPKDGDDEPDLIIESCCTTLEQALSAQARGADRIELCTDLSVGGVMPPRDLVEIVVKSLSIPVNVLIRPAASATLCVSLPERLASLDPSQATLGPLPLTVPRVACFRERNTPASVSDAAGRMMGFGAEDFVYTDQDIAQMAEDIAFCKSAGAAGIVVGALTPSGTIDLVAMRRLVAAAHPLPVTFHRAFDVAVGDPFEDLEAVIALGCARLLTSGRAPSAWDGRGLLSRLVRRASGRLIVMPGKGVTPAILPALSAFTRAHEYHGTQLP